MACKCILTTSRKDMILAGIGPILVFWLPKNLKLGFHGIQRKINGSIVIAVACWCILTTSRSDSILVSIGLIVAIWWPKFLKKWNSVFLCISKKNAWREWLDEWHVDVCLPPPEIIRFWSVLAQLWPFGGQKLNEIKISGILRRTHGRTGLKCGTLMYPDHIQKLFHFDPYWHSFGPLIAQEVIEMGGFPFLRRMHGRNVLKCGMLIYPDHLQKLFDFGWYWPNFDRLVATKMSEIDVSRHSNKNAWKEKQEMSHTYVNWPPPEMIRFWSALVEFWPSGSQEIGVFGHSEGNTWKEWLEIWKCKCIWPHSELIWIGPNFGASGGHKM